MGSPALDRGRRSRSESPDEVAVDIGGSIVGRAELGARPASNCPPEPVGWRWWDSWHPPMGAARLRSASRSVAEVALASAHVVLPAAHAADLLGAAGKVDRLTVLPAQGVDPRVWRPPFGRRCRPDSRCSPSPTARSRSRPQSRDSTAACGAVTGFALLTVAIAALAVANVYTVVLAQRTRELALLRLVGASRSQLARTVLGEALVVGTLGATCGLGAGAVLGWAAVAAVDPIGVRASIAVTLPMVAAALAVGVAVTLLGAAVPALRVTRAVPLDAISDTGAGADRSAPWWSGAVLVALGGSVSWTALVAGGLAGPGWQAAAGAGLWRP
ncbi:MAG: ABC transporter permease [Microthrixaceae bacterium]